MPLLSNRRLALLLAFTLARAAAFAAEADERALWNVWTLHKSATSNHVAVIAACRDAEAKLGGSALLPVCRGWLAWHLMQSGDLTGAEAALTNTLFPSGVSALELTSSDMARRWLTRLDRERVCRGLEELYRKGVEYPESLDALGRLPVILRPPMTDRWGQPWKYRLAEFKHFKGLTGQKYVLESGRLGESSDLGAALRQLYPDGSSLVPDRVVSGGDGRKSVMFRTTGDKPETVEMVEGTGTKNATLALVGVRILVLSDGDGWFLLGKPAE